MGADDSFIRNDNSHRNIVDIRFNSAISHLKIMAHPDEMRPATWVLQKTVIETFAIADPVTRQVKSNPRDDDQIGFISLMINTCRAWFKDTERPFLQLFNLLYTAKHHMMAADRRIQHPFSRLEGSGQNQPCIGFVVGRGIQRHTLSLMVFIQRKQIELCGKARCQPRIMAERPTLGQQLRTERTLGHTDYFRYALRSGPEVNSRWQPGRLKREKVLSAVR